MWGPRTLNADDDDDDLHNSNKKTQCSICLQFAHMYCINTDADTFFV